MATNACTFSLMGGQPRPGLWGYGLACEKDAVTVREKSLGLALTGRFDTGQDRLHLTVTGVAGSAPMTFARMPEDSVHGSGDGGHHAVA